jgi:ABC-type glycerol-3-phosphate transport system substrate-binding protein
MKHGVMMVLAVAALAAALVAEEKFGVKVYEGAKADKETTAAVSEAFSMEAFCYRTADGLEKVVAFYKKEPGLEFVGESKEGAMFRKGNVDVTIQTPWMNMKTGQLMKDVLITIVRREQAESQQR